MLIKSRYSNLEMFLWTRFATLKFIGYAFVIGLFYEFLGYYFLRIPWAPLAVIGTAVAFIVGFRNNASYDRIWEARKIWGGIVNTSRTWGMKTRDMISNKHAKNVKTDLELTKIRKRLVYRHIAWMTALRHAMRTQKKWEDFGKDRSDRSWMHMLNIPEYKVSLEEELIGLIDEDGISGGNKTYLDSGGPECSSKNGSLHFVLIIIISFNREARETQVVFEV